MEDIESKVDELIGLKQRAEPVPVQLESLSLKYDSLELAVRKRAYWTGVLTALLVVCIVLYVLFEMTALSGTYVDAQGRVYVVQLKSTYGFVSYYSVGGSVLKKYIGHSIVKTETGDMAYRNGVFTLGDGTHWYKRKMLHLGKLSGVWVGESNGTRYKIDFSRGDPEAVRGADKFELKGSSLSIIGRHQFPATIDVKDEEHDRVVVLYGLKSA